MFKTDPTAMLTSQIFLLAVPPLTPAFLVGVPREVSNGHLQIDWLGAVLI